LQQPVVVRILAHRPVQKQHLAAPSLQFLQQHHLMHVMAGQPVGIGDRHSIHLRRPDRIPGLDHRSGHYLAISRNTTFYILF
jgi:hypothetical protein